MFFSDRDSPLLFLMFADISYGNAWSLLTTPVYCFFNTLGISLWKAPPAVTSSPSVDKSFTEYDLNFLVCSLWRLVIV